MSILPQFFNRQPLDKVFTPGGQPSITYVSRDHLKLEATLKKSLALPNTIVSLTGETKAGKTVLCRSVLLHKSQYIWIDGGQIKDEKDIWNKTCSELRIATEVIEASTDANQISGGASVEKTIGIPAVAQVKMGATAGGSVLKSVQSSVKYIRDNMDDALEALIADGIYLVIDDFHYMKPEVQTGFIQSVKGPVYRGLKVVILSTPHRAFEAVKAEPEITGRFKHVTVPPWSKEDLMQIAKSGFEALNASPDPLDINAFASEAESSPLLMQRFCWNVCYDSDLMETSVLQRQINVENRKALFDEVAEDAGLPIYERLSKGPQSRTDRIRRPLIGGGDADIYEAILLAIARTGPREKLTYDQIRTSLTATLAEKVPQKLEVSNALIHLAAIAFDKDKTHKVLDWDADGLDLFITDPFFRFYMRWKIAKGALI